MATTKITLFGVSEWVFILFKLSESRSYRSLRGKGARRKKMVLKESEVKNTEVKPNALSD